MEQLALFQQEGPSHVLPDDLLEYRPGYLGKQEGTDLMHNLMGQTPWITRIAKMYDKEVLTPRLMAWYGDPDDVRLRERLDSTITWTHELWRLKSAIEALAGYTCNAVLLNYYRDQQDSVAWHSDKESVQGRKTIVASLSLGQVRSFDVRLKSDHSIRYSIRLEHGSLLIMRAGFQEWEHRIAKSTRPMKARLNLTFRQIGE